jgi:hypothetical protein
VVSGTLAHLTTADGTAVVVVDHALQVRRSFSSHCLTADGRFRPLTRPAVHCAGGSEAAAAAAVVVAVAAVPTAAPLGSNRTATRLIDGVVPVSLLLLSALLLRSPSTRRAL